MENILLNMALSSCPCASVRECIIYAGRIYYSLYEESNPTLSSIPARTRAVSAPREEPKRQILSPAWSGGERESQGRARGGVR